MGKELKGVYALDFSDAGYSVITATYNNMEAEVLINTKGPNLRSTENNTEYEHLYFQTSDNKYLCVKEVLNNE